MLHLPKIDDYLEILTYEKVKDFVVINFSEYIKSTKEKLNSKLNKKPNKNLFLFPRLFTYYFLNI